MADKIKADQVDEILGAPRGSFKYFSNYGTDTIAGMRFVCPCGCDALGSLQFKPIYPKGWEWDGNEAAPTVTPSIHQSPCGWHGFLTKGFWKSV